MLISKHAISRVKQRGLVPKTASAKKVKRYIRGKIEDCYACYVDKKTGAKVYLTDSFQAVYCRGVVVTIYPKQGPS